MTVIRCEFFEQSLCLVHRSRSEIHQSGYSIIDSKNVPGIESKSLVILSLRRAAPISNYVIRRNISAPNQIMAAHK